MEYRDAIKNKIERLLSLLDELGDDTKLLNIKEMIEYTDFSDKRLKNYKVVASISLVPLDDE